MSSTLPGGVEPSSSPTTQITGKSRWTAPEVKSAFRRPSQRPKYPSRGVRKTYYNSLPAHLNDGRENLV